ncbi:MAG: 2-oxoacid:acceptor oxidoreductase subunit alpha [Rhodospirillaceae bacterium]|nr:2-oxoacid:acceptor oxidoreductase subunit alpha [Rhodospirillaceae bacterium]MBT4428451.1 2-oxoacid:acceptor oxidoreductase subunit alpha [Rhodospirillaceae bacterium]MBT7291065.1 2-oxoacid:acceptor oxidoreductase subunit alpha [Rhodospirillaceae bacterium]
MSKTEANANRHNVQGNHACALAAIAAGCRFYAGYPITPSSEVAERMSLELPKVGGVFIQMEDEIASMGAVLGASMGGLKAMTATSGPGFSLKQEHIGYGILAETPSVVINVMRGGPSTGMPTRPSQGDVMQARWGTHGDHTAIVLAPASVAEVYTETVRAFNLAEQLRSPVIVLFDEIIGHLVETIQLPAPESLQLIERKWADAPKEGYLPYAAGDDMIPPMPRPGDGYRSHTTGLTHDESGFPTQDPAKAEAMLARLINKVERHRDVVDAADMMATEDADILVVAYGTPARAARRAVKEAREQGIKLGLFRPITLWPFPERAFLAAAKSAKRIIVAEMNAGQLLLEIERIAGRERVSPLLRFDGEHIAPDEILDAVGEAA